MTWRASAQVVVESKVYGAKLELKAEVESHSSHSRLMSWNQPGAFSTTFNRYEPAPPYPVTATCGFCTPTRTSATVVQGHRATHRLSLMVSIFERLRVIYTPDSGTIWVTTVTSRWNGYDMLGRWCRVTAPLIFPTQIERDIHCITEAHARNVELKQGRCVRPRRRRR